MRTIAITVLSVALAAAIVSGGALYQKQRNTRDALLMSERRAAALELNVDQLNRELSSLSDRLSKSAQKLRDLEAVQTRITELERAIAHKDHVLSQSEETLRTLQRDLEEERKIHASLEVELASKDISLTELKEQREGLQSQIRYFQEEVAKGHSEMEGLNRKLTALEEQWTTCKSEMLQVQATCEANLSHRLKEFEGARARISELGHALALKDHTLSEYKESIHTLQEDLKEERKTTETLTAQLASKDAMATQLYEQLQGARSRIHSLDGEMKETRTALKEIEGRLSTLRGEKVTAERKIGQLRSTYEVLISDLKEQIENQEVTIKRYEEKISVTFVDRILFEFGKATIVPEGKVILKRVGDALRDVEGRKIRVVGHTDNKPILPEYHYKYPSNWELSAARASAVVRHFQSELKVDPRRLEAAGRSFYDPIASNETAEGRAQNRRVEIIIAPQLE